MIKIFYLLYQPYKWIFSPQAPPAERERGEELRDLLRLAYAPYTWLVFAPFMLASTVLAGSVTGAASLVDPRWGFAVTTTWARLLCWANFTHVTVEGDDGVDPRGSYILMSNHQSQFDIPVLYRVYGARRHQFRWVMKQELRKVPGLGWGAEKAGCIFVDRSNTERAVASLRDGADRLEPGVSVLFFPEGTRSRDGRLMPFKKGGFMMALETGLPILPISISGTHHILPGHSSKLLLGHATVRLHPPIDPAAYGHERCDELMAEVRRVIASGLSPWERGEG